MSLGLFKNGKAKSLSIFLLLATNIICGLFIFQGYGLSWDEPFFYDYADALGYAYSPKEWLSGDFNLENAYGSSATDHANRGPAYILLARQPVNLLKSIGFEPASAWHLVNFLTFQLGAFFLYRLALRFMKAPAAVACTALFTWQPLLWGHAFINPKDPPFLAFFLGAVVLGLEMVDQHKEATDKNSQKVFSILLAAIFLGLATSIRVLGPLAGLLVTVYALIKIKNRIYLVTCLLVYVFTATLTMLITWPYLWPDPISRFVEVFRFMSENPTQLAVLFNGEIYRADELPRRYLPVLLGLTLTEPVWLLFVVSLSLDVWKQFFGTRERSTTRRSLITDHWMLGSDFWLILLWFLIPFFYVVLRKPPIYDGYRHFLFILPPVFILAGMALDKLYGVIQSHGIAVFFTLLLLAPGIFGIIQLHPYQYAYYNSFTGGIAGAFRTYETDYWLTCYKEAMENFQTTVTVPATMYVHREAYIAEAYAGAKVQVLEERGALNLIEPGDYILVNSRANEDLRTFKGAPIVMETGRGGAVFCVIKRIP